MKFRFKHLSSRFHLALGLSSLVVSVLLMAQFAGLVPDREGALRAGRVALAETVAVSSMAMLGDEDPGRLQQVLDFVVQRNPDLRAIRLLPTAGGGPLAGWHAGGGFSGRSFCRSSGPGPSVH